MFLFGETEVSFRGTSSVFSTIFSFHHSNQRSRLSLFPGLIVSYRGISRDMALANHIINKHERRN